MLRHLLAFVVLSFLAPACAGGETLQLAEGDSLGQFRVASGDTIEITLEENASTGYRWDLVAIPEMLTVGSDEYIEPDTDLVGAPGTHVFSLEADHEGAGVLRLEYIRPFDDPVVPERVAEYIIIVDQAQWPPEPQGSSLATSTAPAP